MKQLAVLLALCLVGLASCATPNFDRAWKAAVAKGSPAQSIEGPWVGTWTSNATGHTGHLRCLVTENKVAARHDFHYWAQWKVFQTDYHAAYPVSRSGSRWSFQGQSDLGFLGGGVYTHIGEATPETFKASYQSAKDHGVFSMTRPR